jgi:type II secretory pathway component GspD/PulD (secretin)
MRHLLLAGVMVLSATGSAAAQVQPATLPGAPITITFVDARLEDALSFIAKHAGFTLELDASITEEMRRSPVPQQPIRLTNITVAEALDMVTSLSGLTYTIAGPKTIRISRKV